MQQKIADAKRRQREAEDRADEAKRRDYAERGLKPPTVEELRQRRARLEAEREAERELRKNDPDYIHVADLADRLLRVPMHMEGFVAGWLAATGQFDKYAELFQIWLDTPKSIDPLVSDHQEVVDPLARFNARLGISHAPRAPKEAPGKRGKP